MIYLLCDKNETWINNQYQQLVKKLFNNYDTYDYQWSHENKMAILSHLINNDLLVSNKVILIKNYTNDSDVNRLLSNWDDQQKDIVLILTSDDKKLAKLNSNIKIIQNNNAFNQKATKKNILNLFLNNNNLKLDADLYEWLINNNFSDAEIINQLTKIKHLKNIKLADVECYCDFKITNKIFDLLDKIWDLKFPELITIYQHLDLEDGQIFYFINKEFVNIYIIKHLSIVYRPEQINDILKMHPFRFKKLLKKSHKIDLEQLNQIFVILKNSQINSYKTFIDKATIVQILIYDISRVICII